MARLGYVTKSSAWHMGHARCSDVVALSWSMSSLQYMFPQHLLCCASRHGRWQILQTSLSGGVSTKVLSYPLPLKLECKLVDLWSSYNKNICTSVTNKCNIITIPRQKLRAWQVYVHATSYVVIDWNYVINRYKMYSGISLLENLFFSDMVCVCGTCHRKGPSRCLDSTRMLVQDKHPTSCELLDNQY